MGFMNYGQQDRELQKITERVAAPFKYCPVTNVQEGCPLSSSLITNFDELFIEGDKVFSRLSIFLGAYARHKLGGLPSWKLIIETEERIARRDTGIVIEYPLEQNYSFFTGCITDIEAVLITLVAALVRKHLRIPWHSPLKLYRNKIKGLYNFNINELESKLLNA